MTYQPTWTNGDDGRVTGGMHAVMETDAVELAEAINRRRRLVYLGEQDFSSQVGAGLWVRQPTIAGQISPPFENFRAALVGTLLNRPAGGMGGQPPTPSSMEWLWPVTGELEDSVIVAQDPQEGQVGLFEQLNQTDDWTDAALLAGQSDIRAVHFNELRQAVEWLSRGRWRLPLYLPGGLFSLLPNTPWIGDSIANNGTDELRSCGFALLRTAEEKPRGLVNVTAGAGTHLELNTDVDCAVEVYHCVRPIDFVNDLPTWNEYAPGSSSAWAAPGGTGSGDAVLLGSANLTAGVATPLSGSAMRSAAQAMIGGAPSNFLIRRVDSGYQTIWVWGEVVVEFDLDNPPN